jgi:hypothetical protein
MTSFFNPRFSLRALWLLVFLLPFPLFGSPAFPDYYSTSGPEVARLSRGWSWSAAGALRSVEVQGDGTLLIAGGPSGAFLLHEVKGAWLEKWDWESLGLKAGDISCAVAAEQDPYGRVNLVLAAEPGKKRIFLAEARSHQVKIRWEYPLKLPPRRVRLCPDSAHFLVLSADGTTRDAWRLEEVDFQTEKTVWGFSSATGPLRPDDMIRLKNGWTILSDLLSGRVAAFDKEGKKVWVQTVAKGWTEPLASFPLAFEKGRSQGTVLALAVAADGKTVLARLNAKTGERLGSWTSASQSGVEFPIPSADSISAVSTWKTGR